MKILREGADSSDRDDIPTASPVTGESFEEQIARVGLMSEGDPQWDLSENDCDALHAVLCSHDDLVAALRRMLDCHQAAIDAAQSSASRFVEKQCDCGACNEARIVITKAEGSHVA